jgi:UDP-N-acetylglucosamine--N-acetylmuramyl-(pentapeptide) pyrophosphoryl-undecaprenol N-acetylglucosamine transferase
MTTVMIAGGGTGGHLMPALAIADRLRTERPAWRVVLVGAERGVEARLLPSRPYPFHLLPAEPIYRRQWWKNVRWPLIALRLRRQVDELLQRERPAVVLGTGGYASGPVVWRAASKGIPTAILEQDAFPGLTSRWLAKRVRHLYLGAPEAIEHLRPGRAAEVFVTGCPILAPDRALRNTAHLAFNLDPLVPVVLVTGGSQGALGINRAVAEWVRAGGAAGVQLLWATGRGTFEHFRELHAPPAVQIFDFLDPIAPALAAADVAVTRAGAVTIAELAAWGIPSVLVPLPTAAADHQTRNARVMAEAGAAVMVPQAELTAERLGMEVGRLLHDGALREGMASRARCRGKPEATAEILGHLEALADRG